MIQGGSQGCYLLVALHALVFPEVQVDYLSKMTSMMMMISRVLLMLMMLIHQILMPGTLKLQA